MIKRKVKITREKEDPAKRAVSFVNMADQFACEIHFQVNDVTYNGKSVISVMIADFAPEQILEVICDGEEEKEAIDVVCQWFQSENKI